MQTDYLFVFANVESSDGYARQVSKVLPSSRIAGLN